MLDVLKLRKICSRCRTGGLIMGSLGNINLHAVRERWAYFDMQGPLPNPPVSSDGAIYSQGSAAPDAPSYGSILRHHLFRSRSLKRTSPISPTSNSNSISNSQHAYSASPSRNSPNFRVCVPFCLDARSSYSFATRVRWE